MSSFYSFCFSRKNTTTQRVISNSHHILTLLFIISFTVIYHLPYFDLSKDITRKPASSDEFTTDLTPQFGVHAEIFRQSFTDNKSIPHWNPYIMGGQPFLSGPGVNLFSLENVLVLFFRGQVAARLSIPLHLLLGWIGLYLFFIQIGLQGKHAIMAGLIYLYNPTYMAVNSFTGHLNIINGVSYVPWLLYYGVKPFKRSLSRSFMISIVLSLMVHSGAVEIFLFSSFFGLTLFIVYHRAIKGSNLVKSVAEALLIVVVVTGLTIIKIAPAIEFLSISDRKEGMISEMGFYAPTYRDGFNHRGYYLEYGEPKRAVQVTPYPVVMLLGLAAGFGLFKLFGKNRLLFFTIITIAIIPVAISYSYSIFKIFWEIPLFKNQRTPDKAMFVTFLAIAVLSSYGIKEVLFSRFKNNFRHALPLLTIILLLYTTYFLRPPFPSMDDLALRRANNGVLNYVKQDNSFFRITSFQDEDRNWGYEHQTVPEKIGILLGFARLWHSDMLFSLYTMSMGKAQFPFVPVIFRNFASMTGLLSIKYVSSTKPINVAGLEFVGKFDPMNPEPQPEKSRGPYLYRNTKTMPRAYQGPPAVLICGSENYIKKRGILSISRSEFDGRGQTLLYSGRCTADTKDNLFEYSSFILPESNELVPDKYGEKIIDENELFKKSPVYYEVSEVKVDEVTPDRLVLKVTKGNKGKWLILSEKFALFKGWSAYVMNKSSDKIKLPIIRANHVNSAIWLPEGEYKEVIFVYETPYFSTGIILLVVTLVLIISYFIRFHNLRELLLQRANLHD